MADLPDIGICYPEGADWLCTYSQEDLDEMIADPAVALVMARSEALAWRALSSLTGGQVGTCPITVRPCLAGCNDSGTWQTAPIGSNRFSPFIGVNGRWYNSCGCPAADCSCVQLCEVVLAGPVGGIEEVWVDGAVLSPTAYRVDNGNRLVRTDAGCWPTCQDMRQDAHGEDSFSVRYYQGAAPDALSKYAAGLLAAEFYKACKNDKTCRLPAGVRSVSRQGVTYEIQTDMFSEGTTGIREVDAVVATYNPFGLRSRPVISSPDFRRPRATTWGR